MSLDDSMKMPMYHVQLETRHRTISYEIATQNFNHVEIAKMHLSKDHVGGCSSVGYAAKNDFAQSRFLEARNSNIGGRGQPFEENEE